MMKLNKILSIFCLSLVAAEHIDSDPSWNSDDGYEMRHSYPSPEPKNI